ncbi:hypothetical protein AUQ44_00890 [Vibrio cidicii]|uniref:KAP NTPase domain-containing protein n=1 Tax=Vibrio cidicii TaxID=1763883 RepID=A0A151JFF6_9VIBR|nr:hypothetical protein [Vibrio cidicii]KYN24519.1 hypothetical protein AUQ44_00890 [Vibrio cidicii]
MSHMSEQILALLEDDSFPSMVRIDGEWGTGKTHYIKNELLPFLEGKNKKVIFFSLIGLSSLDDFRDKLISCVYFSEKFDQGFIGKLSEGMFAILDKSGESGSTVSSILKGSTGVVKHAMLNRISNVTVILDDLERVADSALEKDIVGECLQLIDEKDLEFIFVMNGNKTSIDKAMLEKAFSDRVYFNRPSHEVIKIAFSNYEYFLKYRELIEQRVQALDFTNLRAMKRAANRLNNIYKLINKDNSLDVEASMELIIVDVIRISYLHYCMEKTSEEIIKGLDYGANLKFGFENEEENDEFEKYRTINTPTDEMVEYCCGKTHLPPIIENLGRLPLRTSKIDKLIFSRCYMLDEKEFNESLSELRKFIFHDVEVSMSKWFESCDFYLFLLDNKFVEEDKECFLAHLNELCKRKNFDFSDLDNRFRGLMIETQDILDRFNYQKDIVIKERDELDICKMFEKIKVSWCSMELEVYRRFRLNNFINKKLAAEWIEIIIAWDTKNIGQFSGFIFDRYRESNIRDWLSGEKDTLIELSEMLSVKIANEKSDHRRGTLGLLKKSIDTGIAKM